MGPQDLGPRAFRLKSAFWVYQVLVAHTRYKFRAELFLLEKRKLLPTLDLKGFRLSLAGINPYNLSFTTSAYSLPACGVNVVLQGIRMASCPEKASIEKREELRLWQGMQMGALAEFISIVVVIMKNCNSKRNSNK